MALTRDYAGRDLRIVAVNSNDVARYPEDSFERMQERDRELDFPFDYLFDERSGAGPCTRRGAHARGLPLRRGAATALPRSDRRLSRRQGGDEALSARGDRGATRRRRAAGRGDRSGRLQRQVEVAPEESAIQRHRPTQRSWSRRRTSSSASSRVEIVPAARSSAISSSSSPTSGFGGTPS